VARKVPTKKTATKNKGKSHATHAAKKPRISANGVGKQLALRPATNGKPAAPRTRKPIARPSLAADADGLYAEVFAKGQTADAVTAEWLSRYEKHNVNAMCELVNFIFKCAGTDLTVDNKDIEDVDNVARRINDLQETYQAQEITEYPLVSKAKKYRAFQSTLVDFFTTLIQTLHHSSVLYNDAALIENIQVWVASMSTAPNRPFRHTATVIALSLTTTLCDLAQGVISTISTSRKQLESEKKKKTVNKGRVGAIQSAIHDGEKKLETIDELVRDSFDTVFVHRYRDVDPKIRAECMVALGGWVHSYRQIFFEGQYLRYFGWMLSDAVSHTRAVVVAQLRSLFENKDNIAGLRGFADRFRFRIVEMAAQDADTGVRSSSIELLDLIREAGLMELDEVDSVGRLVFDTEPRVRKAAGRFFVANVEDVFESMTEEVNEELNELLADEDDEDSESPKRSWIKYKCLVDILQNYDGQGDQLNQDRSIAASREALSGAPVESRFVLAIEAIYPHLEELAQWQSLAGYLLYDHSQITGSPDEDDSASVIRRLYRLEEGQDAILLEVLVCSVKLRILDVAKSDIDKRGRKIKALTDKIPTLQEEIAHNLAQIIPQLLNKFGAVPEAASAVLRLEHLVDLDMIQDFQKDATAYSSLLNDINKQFLTHSDQDVLAEASVAFLHARSSDEMKEAMESKVQELWDDMVDALSTLTQGKDVQNETSIRRTTLTELVNTVIRISNLSSITDCIGIMETIPSRTSKKGKQLLEAPFNTLVHLTKRGLRDNDSDDEIVKLETELVFNSIKALLFYFMWKVQGLTAALRSGNASFSTAYFEALTKSRAIFVATLTAIMQQHRNLDEICFTATTTLLDVQTLFGTLRQAGAGMNSSSAAADEETVVQIQSLAYEIDSSTQNLISFVHDLVERAFAKKAGKNLEPADDDAPLNSESDIEKIPSDDEEEEEEEDANDEDDSVTNDRLRATILAEQRLCELTGKIVLAIIGRVLDTSGQQRGTLKQKLLRNRTRLGHNYKEVLAYLDDRKSGSAGRQHQTRTKQSAKATGQAGGAVGAAKSSERVEDEDDENDDNPNGGEDRDEGPQAGDLAHNGNVGPDNDEGLSLAPSDREDEVMSD
jgi:cohesin complex subunit SA-1/2